MAVNTLLYSQYAGGFLRTKNDGETYAASIAVEADCGSVAKPWEAILAHAVAGDLTYQDARDSILVELLSGNVDKQTQEGV